MPRFADDPANFGTLTLNGGADGTLIAASDENDPYVGVLFYQDRLAPSYLPAKGNKTPTAIGAPQHRTS